MFFMPVLVAFAAEEAEERRENYERRPAFSAEPIHRHLRLTDEHFDAVSEEYHEWRIRQTGIQRGLLHASQKRMQTFLLYLASGGYHRQVGLTQGIAKSTAILHSKEVADFFLDISDQHITLPMHEELDNLSTALLDMNGIERQVVLYLDGVIIQIQRPDHAGDAYFCGRHGKSCDSINAQIVVDKFGRVRHVISGLPGSTHDKTAIEWSVDFIRYLDQLPENYVVLADPAYRNFHPAVLVTFTGRNLQPDQLAFNDRCTRLRQIVERGIGAIELKWRMNQMKENRYPAKYGPEFAAKCSVATCVLHNRYTNFLE